MIEYLITNERVGQTRTLIADYSARVQNLSFASNNRGFAECSGFVPMGLSEAFGLYSAIGGLRVQVCDTSSGAVYDGRIEDIAIDGDGVTITAMGFSRSLADIPYTALWSASSAKEWQALTASDLGGAAEPTKYAIDFNNRLYVGLQKGTAYTNGLDYGVIGFRRPSGSSRGIVGLAFDLIVCLPIGWDLIISRRDDAWGSGATIDTISGTGGSVVYARVYTFTSSGAVTFLIYNNTAGTPYNHTLENGISFINLTNVRVVTATTNMVNTTATATVGAGTGVTLSVVSTARMYAGQRLRYGAAGGHGTSLVITSVTNATQFVATTTQTMVNGDVVLALVIYADEIADDLISTISTLNSGQLSSSTALTQTPGLDLLSEVYLDRVPASIMDYLASLGDTNGNLWEWGVRGDQRLYLRPQNGQRVWYIDASDLDIQRTLDQLTNSVYAVYSDANGRAVRATATSDAGSIARYGLTRRAALSVDTTSAAQAAYQQAVALADGKEPRPRAGVVVTQVFDANGARWPLWYVAAGDTMVIRNLSPSLGTAIDRVRVFRLTRAAYSFADDTLTLEPETPIARLDVLLATLAAGVARQTSATWPTS